MLASSVNDHGLEPRSCQIKDYQIGTSICCIFANHTSFRSKSKDWLARNEWSDKLPADSCFIGLVLYTSTWACCSSIFRYHYHLIECNLFSPLYSWKLELNLLIHHNYISKNTHLAWSSSFSSSRYMSSLTDLVPSERCLNQCVRVHWYRKKTHIQYSLQDILNTVVPNELSLV
jgi:hypothetical protein